MLDFRTAPPMLPADFRHTGLHFHRVNPVAPVQFQVLGERGSGTNLVRKLLEKNTPLLRTEGLGWKHAAPHMVAIPDHLVTICAVRNATNWARSMFNRPWHADPRMQQLGFSQFIRAQWQGIVDRPGDFEEIHPELTVEGAILQFDRHPITGLPFENLFQLRRTKLEALMGMLNRDCNVVFVQLETVQRDPEDFVTRFLAALDFSPMRKEFSPVIRRMGQRMRMAVRDRPAAPEAFSPEDRKFMLSQLDLRLEATLGYDY